MTEFSNINLRVTDAERWGFKAWCAEHRISQVDAFRAAFDLLKFARHEESRAHLKPISEYSEMAAMLEDMAANPRASAPEAVSALVRAASAIRALSAAIGELEKHADR